MTDKLPPQLLTLFQPRPPLRYIPPQDASPEDAASKISQLTGVAAFLPALEEYAMTDVYQPTESWLQKRDLVRKERRDRQAEMIRDDFDGYQPDKDPQIKGDPAKTLFIARLSYEAKESDLEKEFARFGPIERVSFSHSLMLSISTCHEFRGELFQNCGADLSPSHVDTHCEEGG